MNTKLVVSFFALGMVGPSLQCWGQEPRPTAVRAAAQSKAASTPEELRARAEVRRAEETRRREEIQRNFSDGKTVLPAAKTATPTDSVIAALDRHAAAIVANAAAGTLVYSGSEKTTDKPGRAYKATFVTGSDALKTDSAGGVGDGAFLRNQGIAAVWKTAFCTANVSAVVAQNGLWMVSGQLRDKAGEIQTIAMCTK